MPDYAKAHSVEEGIIVDEDNGGPFYTGGVVSPVGLGLPASTIYTQTDAAGIFIWKKVGAGDTAADWRKYSAQDIPTEDPGGLYRSGIDTVQKALDNIRVQRVSQLDSRDSDLESFHQLSFDDNTFHQVIGSGSGYYFLLPDATACLIGQEFEIYNGSSNSIEVRNFGGTNLVTLNSGDLVRFLLQGKATSLGNWLLSVSTTTATGIQSYVVASDTTFTTTSTTDVLITGFSVTPVSGRYAVWYSADIIIGANNRVSENAIYVDGSPVENTRRVTQGVGSNYNAAQNSVGEVIVNGAQAVDVRVNINAGSLDVNQRSLILIRLGS